MKTWLAIAVVSFATPMAPRAARAVVDGDAARTRADAAATAAAATHWLLAQGRPARPGTILAA